MSCGASAVYNREGPGVRVSRVRVRTLPALLLLPTTALPALLFLPQQRPAVVPAAPFPVAASPHFRCKGSREGGRAVFRLHSNARREHAAGLAVLEGLEQAPLGFQGQRGEQVQGHAPERAPGGP